MSAHVVYRVTVPVCKGLRIRESVINQVITQQDFRLKQKFEQDGKT